MRIGTFVVAGAFFSMSVMGQQSQNWQDLIQAGNYKQAEVLCSSWTTAVSLNLRVEAEKCLANVELGKGQMLQLQGNDTGGGTLGEGWSPEAVDKALAHLNKGISLAPQDLSIHQGRLKVLEESGRFEQMAKALDESASIYKGPDALQAWLAYDSELGDAGQAQAGIEISEVLNRHYPNDHNVLGNLGAFHSMLKEWDQGLPYLKQAVALAPGDPLDNWNLGWAYAHLNQNADADKWMSKALQLDPSEKQTPGCACLYANFVESNLKDRVRACALEKKSCEKSQQTACDSKPDTQK